MRSATTGMAVTGMESLVGRCRTASSSGAVLLLIGVASLGLPSTAWLQPSLGNGSLRNANQASPSLEVEAPPKAFATRGSQTNFTASATSTLGSAALVLLAASGLRVGSQLQAVRKTRAVVRCRAAAAEEDIEASAAVDVPVPAEVSEEEGLQRRSVVQLATAGVASTVVGTFAGPDKAQAEAVEEWVQYDLNTGETLYDICFDPLDSNHGFIVGARGLFYETKDGGRRWVSRSFKNLSKDEDLKYRFQTVTCKGNEVWILGKPSLLLHSKDSGKSWVRVPVSSKLPGLPQVITSLGEGKAEMATTSGAVYSTENNGRNWTSKVKETVDATLNRASGGGVSGASYFTGSVKSIKRDSAGKYLAVAQRGNFYLTFEPGQEFWLPHNRVSARRIQAMGFRDAEGVGQEKNEGVWMTLNGGFFTQATTKDYSNTEVQAKDAFKYANIRSGGIGIIDAAWRSKDEAYAVGGSGIIYYSKDAGQTWRFDNSGNDLPCNLYNIKFFDNGKVGFMIGSNGILLRRSWREGDKPESLKGDAAVAAPKEA